MRTAQSRVARQALDRRLDQMPDRLVYARPHRGWIRAIREALGMSAADLAGRMQITTASVSDMERSERARRIRLDTLERAAEAMGCELIYAVVPRGSLGQIVEDRARSVIDRELHAVYRAMDLEAQSTDIGNDAVRVEMQRLIDSGRLWK